MKDLLAGISYFADGFQLITKRGIKRFVIVPLIINILIFIGAFFLFKHYVNVFDHWILLHIPHWLKWLTYLVWILFFISFFILFIYTFVTIANLISAPFNSLLSEKIEAHLTGRVSTSQSLWQHIKDVPRILSRQFYILGYYLPRAVLLLILFFIPVVQTIAPILWFLFNAWFMTFTYIDYPTDNNHVAIRDVRAWLKRNRGLSWGFGIAALALTMVPLLNLFAIPAAVAGATKYWVKRH